MDFCQEEKKEKKKELVEIRQECEETKKQTISLMFMFVSNNYVFSLAHSFVECKQ